MSRSPLRVLTPFASTPPSHISLDGLPVRRRRDALLKVEPEAHEEG